jgi:hypothetical protein
MHIMFWVLGLFLTMLVLVPIILVKETVPPPRFMHVMFWVVRLFLPLLVAIVLVKKEFTTQIHAWHVLGGATVSSTVVR